MSQHGRLHARTYRVPEQLPNYSLDNEIFRDSILEPIDEQKEDETVEDSSRICIQKNPVKKEFSNSGPEHSSPLDPEIFKGLQMKKINRTQIFNRPIKPT